LHFFGVPLGGWIGGGEVAGAVVSPARGSSGQTRHKDDGEQEEEKDSLHVGSTFL
jgi:hypothetical protein